MSRGFIREVVEASVDHLQTRGEFQGLGMSILARYKGSISDTIDAELGKLGIYVYVWPIRPLKVWQNGPGLVFDEFAWRAEVGEDPTMNKTGLTAEYAAELVALHMLNLELPILNGTFCPAEDCIAEADDADLNSYFVNLRAQGGVPPLP